MRNLEARMEKIEQQVDAILGQVPPTPEEVAAKQEAWNELVKRWVLKLSASMDPAHRWVIEHWVQHVLKRCHEQPCAVLPAGLITHLDILWGWKRDESRPIALPAAMVECYRAGDAHQQLNTRPHLDCEDCGYPIPCSFFFVQGQQHCPFERCPVCGCHTIGWHAYDIAHGSDGYKNLKPYSRR